MKAVVILLFLLTGIISGAIGQKGIDLTFTAVDGKAYVQLDSIRVMNITHACDTVIYWPDTVLSIFYVGIQENSDLKSDFKVFQNYPNPVTNTTNVSLYVPHRNMVSIIVTDILGRVIVQCDRVLDKGKHSFCFTPEKENLYFFTAGWKGQSRCIKILKSGNNSGGTSTLEYIGSETFSPQFKTTKEIQTFFCYPGDKILNIGYVDGFETAIQDSAVVSSTYTFQFATNIPCLEAPTVDYEGQVYNTIQVFNQCWLKENLNVGTMILGNDNMTNNGTIEKYCYNNDIDSCTRYGGLYQWNEMMDYNTQQGGQGICPPGWHLPTDREWKILEGAVDSLYRIGDPEWEAFNNFRGYDVGTNLKTISGWYANGNGTDLYGFSGLPSNYRNSDGTFNDDVGHHGAWWTSTKYTNNQWYRYLKFDNPGVSRVINSYEGMGFSVRCLKDD